jgi:hypothetical protein
MTHDTRGTRGADEERNLLHELKPSKMKQPQEHSASTAYVATSCVATFYTTVTTTQGTWLARQDLFYLKIQENQREETAIV